MRHTKWVKAGAVVRSTLARGTATLAAALLVLGVAGLTACGGGGGEKAAATPTADEATQQAKAAEAARQLEARRQQLEQAKEAVSKIRTEAGTVPVKDEALEKLLASLGQATSAAGSELEGDGATAALDRVSALEKQASDRLAELKAEEQAALAELRAQYEEVVAKSKPLPPGVIRGFDGERYLDYMPKAVERAQGELKTQGFYDGPATGTLDEDTRVGIARFQQLNGLLVTGIPTPYTRAKLYAKPSE
jgi:hypothetical protein